MTSASGAEWRANNLLWAMIGIYGRQEVQDAPANGGIILFMTVPLVGMLGSSAWFLLAPSYIENFPSEQRLRNQYCYHMGILLLIFGYVCHYGRFPRCPVLRIRLRRTFRAVRFAIDGNQQNLPGLGPAKSSNESLQHRRSPDDSRLEFVLYVLGFSQNDEVSGAPFGLAGCHRGRRHSDRRFALFCRRGFVARGHAPRYRRRRDSYAPPGLALGLSARARCGIDSRSRSISDLDRRGFLCDQPESLARSRVEVVETSAHTHTAHYL